jgi:hypothetical protein
MLLNSPLYGNYTTKCTSNIFPIVESFEAGEFSACWTIGPSSYGLSWRIANSPASGHPHNAHSGEYYAYFQGSIGGIFSNMLISSSLNLTSVTNPVLKFWHTQQYVNNPIKDQMRVYYKTSVTGTWNLLKTYTSDLTEWTEELIILPIQAMIITLHLKAIQVDILQLVLMI